MNRHHCVPANDDTVIAIYYVVGVGKRDYVAVSMGRHNKRSVSICGLVV